MRELFAVKAGLRSPVAVAVDEVGGALAGEMDCPSRSVLVPLAAEITFQMDLGRLPFQKWSACNLC